MGDATPLPGDPQPCELCRERQAERPPHPRIGRPLEVCWRCGGSRVLVGVNEWDLFDPRTRLELIARRLTFAFAAGCVVPAVHGLVTLVAARDWLWWHALAALGLGWLVAGLGAGGKLAVEIHASRRRMSDPMYRMKLVEFELGASRTAVT